MEVKQDGHMDIWTAHVEHLAAWAMASMSYSHSAALPTMAHLSHRMKDVELMATSA